MVPGRTIGDGGNVLQDGFFLTLEKTNTMVWTPGLIRGEWGDQVYKRRATDEGSTFWDRKRLRLSCANCEVTVAQSALKQHMPIQHGICLPHTRWVHEKGEVPATYFVSFPRVLQLVRFPIPVCPAVCHSAGRLQEHFMLRNFRSRLAVVQEGQEPLPHCDMCGMHMPSGRLIRHRRMAICD